MRTDALRPQVVTLGATVLLMIALLSTARGNHAGSEPRLVQSGHQLATSGTTVAVALRRPTEPADLLVAYVVWDHASTASLADSLGNTWASAVGPTTTADGTSAQVFYACTAAAGAETITATFAAPLTRRAVLYVHEYSGLDPLAPFDAAVASVGTSAAMNVGPLTTETPDELLFVGAASNGDVIAPDIPGWKARARRHGDLTVDTTVATPGPQAFVAMQSGSAWSLQIVAFRKQPRRVYPLKVGPTGRYLVDQVNRPFLITGDSPQALTVNLSKAEAEAFLANRQAAGFNTLWVNLLCSTYTGGRPDGSTYDGIVPFTTPFDLATPNEAFFARVDHMLKRAAAHDIAVFLDPMETGSFLAVLRANGIKKARNFGRYLGTRYRGFDNLVWMSGNDFQSWPNGSDDALVRAVAFGIRDTDDRHLHTVALDYLVSGSLDDPSWAPIIHLNATYTYYPTYAQVLADYNRPNAIPTFLVEANYEGESNNGLDPPALEVLRRQAYWSLLSGAAGQLYGNHYTWPFLRGWQSHLDTPGSRQMGYVKLLFEGRRWWDLVPDQTHTVVTAGYGTFASSGRLLDSDYLTAARTPNGGLVMAYVPTLRTITIDMTKLASAATGRWWDPSIGRFSALSGSAFANSDRHDLTPPGAKSLALFENSGTHDFTPPGLNADGDGDWVLVLEATSVPADTRAPSVPTALAASGVTSSQATISWNASTDDVAVAAYRLYRNGVLQHSSFATHFTDVGLAARRTYSYTVIALDYAGNASAASAPLAVTTAGPRPRADE